ncbi:2'-5' RNA ligase family protein [Aurantimonas sp. Leaf443]|uniref:2'-5' RNA ligase family protein n=1 Tax=Aurantimonas sp. Leaf443 TaxID=1736378 RepID=UPI00070112F2|nr:2'-5' RNA ligase family protein [Aurantimonas sp. Leaf443]KQT88425.1 phosphoesterase HXTX [Aurantimonas sp. Leaf443]
MSEAASGEAAPLIVTLGFEAASFARLDAMRRRHFPSARNHIPAHLTLFHKLPGEEAEAVAATLVEVSRATPQLRLSVKGLRFLGYGTAYSIASPSLVALRGELAARFSSWLTPQDAQRFQPHVTIQNKAPAPVAKALFSELEAEFEPFDLSATGLLLWHYRGGPWEAAGAFPFEGVRGED